MRPYSLVIATMRGSFVTNQLTALTPALWLQENPDWVITGWIEIDPDDAFRLQELARITGDKIFGRTVRL